jgi:hypothetical protein
MPAQTSTGPRRRHQAARPLGSRIAAGTMPRRSACAPPRCSRDALPAPVRTSFIYARGGGGSRRADSTTVGVRPPRCSRDALPPRCERREQSACPRRVDEGREQHQSPHGLRRARCHDGRRAPQRCPPCALPAPVRARFITPPALSDRGSRRARCHDGGRAPRHDARATLFRPAAHAVSNPRARWVEDCVAHGATMVGAPRRPPRCALPVPVRAPSATHAPFGSTTSDPPPCRRGRRTPRVAWTIEPPA